MSSSHVLVSTDWGLLPARWAAHTCSSAQTEGCYPHMCSSAQTEGCYPQDEQLTRARQCRLRVVTLTRARQCRLRVVTLTRARQHRLRVVTLKMSSSHVLVSTDWGLLPSRWAAHTCSSAQTEGCYPQDEQLTRARQHRLRVVTLKMSSSHVLVSADCGLLPSRWAAHMCSSAQTEGCYPQDEQLTCARQRRLRVVTLKMSSSHMLVSADWGLLPSHVLVSADWGLLPSRWAAHTCSSAQTEGCYPHTCSSVQTEGCYPQDEQLRHARQHRLRVVTLTRAHQRRLRVVTLKMSSSHVLVSTDWGCYPHTCSSAQTEGCYPQDEQLTHAHQRRLRVVTLKMSSSHVLFSTDWGLLPSHVLVSTDWGLLPSRWAAHTCSSVQTEGCYPQDEQLTHAHQRRLRVVTLKMSSSHVFVSADWGLLPARWAAHTCSSAQTASSYAQDHMSPSRVRTPYTKKHELFMHIELKYNSNYWSVNLTNFIFTITPFKHNWIRNI